MDDFFPAPSAEGVRALKELSADATRIFLDESDWKTAVSFCQVLPNACRGNYWEMRAKREFGMLYWLISYKYPFHNYLAARVRYLIDQIEKSSFSRFANRPTPSDVDLTIEDLDLDLTTFKSYDLYDLIRMINSNQRKFGESEYSEMGTLAERIRTLRGYFGLDLDENEKEEIRRVQDLKKEASQISKFLAAYLKRTAPETFRRVDLILSSEEYFRIYHFDKIAVSDVLGEQLTQQFLEDHPLMPDSIGIVHLVSIRKQKRPEDYLFLIDSKLYCFALFKPRFFPKAFKNRMLELGILLEHYSLLYPQE